MRKIFLIFLSVCATTVSMAQDNMFVVYSTKGNVTVVDNKEESKPKIGTLLNDNASIRVSQGSFVTLLCNESRMFTINRSGTYSLNKLGDSCIVKKNSSVSANYVKYVWNELTKSKGSPEKNRHAYMANVGAVPRSINNIWIDTKLDTVYFVGGNFPLSWKSFVEAENFEFAIYDKPAGGVIVASRVTSKKHVMINDIQASLESGKEYWWTAMVKGEKNEERKYFKYFTKADYSKIYEQLKLGDASENEAESNFRMGFLLEEAHFLVEAEKHYLNATKLAPDVPLYRATYMSFKKDYELK